MLQQEFFLRLLYKMKGGNSYSSASSYGSYVNGDGNSQFNRVFDKGGQYGNVPGNAMIGAQGQKAGRRRRTRRTRRKRGGNLIPILSQAVVPLSVLGMQQSYKPGTISRLSNFNRGNNFNRRFSRKYPSSRSKRSFR